MTTDPLTPAAADLAWPPHPWGQGPRGRGWIAHVLWRDRTHDRTRRLLRWAAGYGLGPKFSPVDPEQRLRIVDAATGAVRGESPT